MKSFGAKTLTFPTPTWVVGSYDKAGKPNAMTIAWGGICCSDPPCVCVSLRKATYTYGNILHRQAFTVNVPSVNYVKEVDYLGMASGKSADKFAATGLTPVKSELVDAPYVKEFPLVIECKLLQSLEIGLHTEFIGQIVDVKVDEQMLDDQGLPDMAKIQPIIYAPEVRGYYGVGDFLGKAFSIGKSI